MFENSVFILVNKAVTLFFWVAVGANYALGFPEPVGPALKMAGPLIFAAHIVEVVLLLTKFRGGSQNPLADAVQTLVFGIFHLKPIIDKANND